MRTQVLVAFFSFQLTLAFAQSVPSLMSYQGLMTNAAGEVVANGPHTVKFSFYPTATDGNLIWQTPSIPVNTVKGLFTTTIQIPDDARWDQSLFVEIRADNVVMNPRVQLTSVPYAFKAVSASVALSMNASGLSGTVDDARLSTHLQDLADGSLSGDKVGSGINASNVTAGNLPNEVLDSDLQDLASDGILSASKIESIDASKITTGVLDAARIPPVEVQAIDASKITSGTIDPARLPSTGSGPLDPDLEDLADGSLTGSKVGDGINAVNITSGTLDPARLGSVPAVNLSGIVADANLDADLVDLVDGTLSGQKVGSNITADNVNVGTLPNGVLDADLQDLADGSLDGSKVGSGIAAGNITTGTLPVNRGGTGVTSATNGQLLIGNSTTGGFTAATLTAGTGISINNSVPGAITISNAGGTVTSVTPGAGTPLSISNGTTTPVISFSSQNQNAVFAGPLASSGAPTFRALDAADITAGILPISRGGTGAGSSTLINQNFVFASPSAGSGSPSFRALTAGDIPGLDASKITGGILPISVGGTGVTNGSVITQNFVFASPTAGSGGPSFRALAASDIPSLDVSLKTTGTLPINRGGTGATTTSQNFVFAGPSGSSGAPSFRALVTSDLPSSAVTSISNTTGQIAYWNGSNQLTSDGLYWDATHNEIGLGALGPDASLHVTHESGVNHTSGTAIHIENTYSTSKRGIDIDLNDNTASSAIGIDIDIENTGTGPRIGLSSQVTTGVGNNNIVNGIEGIASGVGTSSHRGVYGKAQGTSVTAYQIGVFGEATNSTLYNVGVYGKAPNPGYAVFAEGKVAVLGDLFVDGGNVVLYTGVDMDINGGDLWVNGNISYEGSLDYTGPSDKKLKKDIHPMPPSLQKILHLNPTTYFFRKEEFPRLNLGADRQYGLIAQEVEEVFPELIAEKMMSERRDKEGNITQEELKYKALDYTSLIPILIKGMQEQQALINEQKKMLDKQQAMLDNQRNTDRDQQAMLDLLREEIQKLTAENRKQDSSRTTKATEK